MPKPNHEGNVWPHGTLTDIDIDIDVDILAVEAEIRMPVMQISRRMTVARPPGGRLGIWSAVALDETAEVEPVDTPSPDVGDPDVEFAAVPGTRNEEGALWVGRSGRTTRLLNNIIENLRHPPGFGAWVLSMTGPAGDEAQVPKAVLRLIAKDKAAALGAQLLQWSEMSDLKRIIVSHGETIENDPREVLRNLAKALL